MDYHAYWDQRNAANAEKRYEAALERTRSGEGQLASMIGAEKAKDALSSGLTSLARGGPAKGRRPYLVGEKGPELMVPDQSGTIIPNHKLRTLVKAAKQKRAVPRADGGEVNQGGARTYRPHQQEAEAAVKAGPQAVANYHARTKEMYGGGAPSPAPAAPAYQAQAPERTYQAPAPRQQREAAPDYHEAPAPQPQRQNLRQAAAPAPGNRQVMDTGYVTPGTASDGGHTTALGHSLGVRPMPPVYGGGDNAYSQNRYMTYPEGLSMQDRTDLYHQATQERYERDKAAYKVDLDRYNRPWEGTVDFSRNINGEPMAPAPPARRSLTQVNPGPNRGWKTEANPGGKMPDVRRYNEILPNGLIQENYADYNQMPALERPETQHNPAGPYSQHLRDKRAGQTYEHQDKTWLREGSRAEGGPVQAGGWNLRDAVPRVKGGRAEKEGAPPDTWAPGTGFRNTGGIKAAAGREAELVAAGAELGAPTSYAGGAGAPMPVEIVRGLKTTYTNPAPYSGGGYNPDPSRNTREFASPIQAQQAFNRGQLNMNLAAIGNLPPEAEGGARVAVNEKFGGYDPLKGPEMRLAGYLQEGVERVKAETYNKQPQLQAAADVINSDQAAKLFDQKLKAVYGEEATDDKGNIRYVLPPAIAHAASGYIPQSPAEVDAAIEKAKPAIETAKTVNMFTDPAKGDPARAGILKQYRAEQAAKGQPPDPVVEKYITSSPVGAHNADWFKTAYQRATPAAGPAMVPAPGAPPAIPARETGFVPSAIDNLTLLGKKLGHELGGGSYRPGRVGPAPAAPTLADVQRERIRNRGY